MAAGAVLLGVTSGALGTFAVLRRQSLVGDVMAHAALPGVVGGYLLAGERSLPAMLAGALVTGLVAAGLAWVLTHRLKVKSEAALGTGLGLGFALGVVLLSYVQRQPGAGSAGLESFLYGQAAATLRADVLVLAGVAVVGLGVATLLFGELKVATFDPVWARARGHRVALLDAGLTGLLAVAVVIGLQAVGVVLMSAILVAPAAAARQWSDRLGVIVVLSATFGAAAGVSGALVSASTPRMPTGPTIVICAGVIMLISLLLAPRRGLVAEAVRVRRARRELRDLGLLEDLFTLARQHVNPQHPHLAVVLRTMTSVPETVEPGLRRLEKRGLVTRLPDDSWSLSPEGWKAAISEFGERGDWNRRSATAP